MAYNQGCDLVLFLWDKLGHNGFRRLCGDIRQKGFGSAIEKALGKPSEPYRLYFGLTL